MATLTIPRVEPALPAGPAKKRLSPWQAWGVILLMPYILVFLVFVVYPIGYGLWLARHPWSYEHLVADPVFERSVVNNENVWAKAMNRIVSEKVPVDKAVDELIARIKEVAG